MDNKPRPPQILTNHPPESILTLNNVYLRAVTEQQRRQRENPENLQNLEEENRVQSHVDLDLVDQKMDLYLVKLLGLQLLEHMKKQLQPLLHGRKTTDFKFK